MVNVTGGFAYLDMSVFGVFTNDSSKTVDLTLGGFIDKLKQIDKPTIVCGLTLIHNDHTLKIPAMVVPFLGEGGGYLSIGSPLNIVVIESTGSITVSLGV